FDYPCLYFPQVTNAQEQFQLTDEQKAELKEAFALYAKTTTGRIPVRDLGELLRCLGWNPSEQDLEEARHELELTASGSLSLTEVEDYIRRRGALYYGNSAEEDLMAAFQVLDNHGSGRIAVSSFRRFLTTMGEKMTHDEAEELIASSTLSGQDYIECRDLVQAVKDLPK
ncbi:unnamed protein product, partial [Candidula unifasciata]